jgi:hypothetical protein
MRNWILGACAGMVLACSAFGQEGQPAAPAKKAPASKQASGASTAPAEADLNLLLEGKIRAMWAAFRDKKKQEYGEFMWDDYQAVEEDGDGERNKLRTLREVGQSVVKDFNLQSVRVDRISLEAALVTYENVIQFPRGAGSRFEKIFISEIWMKRSGQWKAWRYQATRVK